MNSASARSRLPRDPTASETPEPQSGRLVRVVAPLVLIGAVVLLTARTAAGTVADPDSLWHVLAGRDLAHRWDFVGDDPFSTFTHETWVRHQWLGELVMSLADRVGGLAGVLWLTAVAQAILVIALYRGARLVSGALPAAVAATVGFVGASGALAPRPQLLGMVFLAVTVAAWQATILDLRPRWWLLAVAWVWSATHGTWVLGALLGVISIAGLLLDRRLDLRQAARLAAIPVGAAVLPVATPLGFHAYESLFSIGAIRPFIAEWSSPSITMPQTAACLAMALLVVAVRGRSGRRVPWVQLGLLAFGVGAALLYVRTIAVGAIVLTPLAAAALHDLLPGELSPPSRPERRALAGMLTAAALLSLALAAAAPTTPGGIPPTIASSLDRLPAGTVVYNVDGLGGSLMWSYPGLRHTSDTRAELYGADSLKTTAHTMAARPGWEKDFDAYRPEAALIRTDSALAGALATERQWRVAASGDGYSLLLPASR